MSHIYDENSPHCRECLCESCNYFYRNGGDCEEGCADCDGMSHIKNCAMFEKVDA